MKIVTTNDAPAFKPVSVTITAETPAELEALRSLAYIEMSGANDIRRTAPDDIKATAEDIKSLSDQLYNVLNWVEIL